MASPAISGEVFLLLPSSVGTPTQTLCLTIRLVDVVGLPPRVLRTDHASPTELSVSSDSNPVVVKCDALFLCYRWHMALNAIRFRRYRACRVRSISLVVAINAILFVLLSADPVYRTVGVVTCATCHFSIGGEITFASKHADRLEACEGIGVVTKFLLGDTAWQTVAVAA